MISFLCWSASSSFHFFEASSSPSTNSAGGRRCLCKLPRKWTLGLRKEGQAVLLFLFLCPNRHAPACKTFKEHATGKWSLRLPNTNTDAHLLLQPYNCLWMSPGRSPEELCGSGFMPTRRLGGRSTEDEQAWYRMSATIPCQLICRWPWEGMPPDWDGKRISSLPGAAFASNSTEPSRGKRAQPGKHWDVHAGQLALQKLRHVGHLCPGS